VSSIAARLNRLPPTRTHRTATVIAGIGSFFDLFDIFLAGVLGTVLTQEFHLSRLALPAIIGSSFVGMFFGATLLGRFADRRRSC
jgi:putative MFS transporter